MSRIHWKLMAGTALLSLWVCAVSSAAFGQAPDGAPQGPPPGPSQDQQGTGQRGPNPERELQTLTRLLTLTPDQQTGVKAVLEQQSEQMKALRNKAQNEASGSGTHEAMQARRSQVEAIRNESITKIAALLDDNQKKTFADWTAKRKAEMEQRRGQGDGVPPPPPNGEL